MKKAITLFLALGMSLSLVACGRGGGKESVSSPTQAPGAENPPAAEFQLTGPVSMIIPYGTGGSVDTVGRLVAQYLSDIIGQQINVINKEGASGAVGMTELSQAKTDGYTIGLTGISDLYVANYRKTFDINSIDYIDWFISVPFALYASPNSPWEDIGELVEDVKSGKSGIAMAESGTAHIIGLAAMCRAAGIDMIQTVSFASGGESQTALLGNHVDLASLTPAYYENVTAGGGKLMGVYGSSKLSLFPDLKYAIDYGLDVPAVVGNNQVIALPKNCPAEVVSFWEDAIQELLADPGFQEAMNTGGYPLCNVFGEELDAAVASNSQAVADIMAELGLE